jgi:cytochrome c
VKTLIRAAVSLGTLMTAFPALSQGGDAGRGEQVFLQQCRNCHTVQKDGLIAIGPNLYGIFGRKAGQTEGFESSEAIKSSGIVWDDTTLAEYLRDPKGRVPDTKMTVSLLWATEPSHHGDINDIIAYLRKVTQ